jgi:cell division protein FtsQ
MLRNQRRLKLFQSLLRTLAVSGIAGGLVWATTRPIWVLREPNQVSIEGNQILSKQVLESLLPLSYPKSLLQIKPEAITRSLTLQPTIAEATVTRQLFPPGLRIKVKERVPVAIALTKPPKGSSTSNPKVLVGLLDRNGMWIPLQTYTSQATTLKLPNLKVIGLPEQYRPYWTQLYQAVSRSPIKVIEIDCQDPTNLILKTELGIVHLGAYSPRLTEQLKVLDKMRQLHAKLNSSQIAYIDLKNPKTPSVQLNHAKELVKPDTL